MPEKPNQPVFGVPNLPAMESIATLPATITVREVCTPPQVAFWTTRDPAKLNPNQKDKLEQLLTRLPDLECAHQLAQGFRVLLMQHQPTLFEDWLARAATSHLAEFQSFAQGLIRDKNAVMAAIATTFSNGPTEGDRR